MNVLTTRTFNNQTYDVLVKAYTTDVTLTSPQNIVNDDKDVILIPTENVTYIMFENSIVDIIPKAEFEILDEGFALTSKLKAENTRIQTTIVKDGGATGGENTTIDTIWIVKKFEVLSVSLTSIHYKIWCECDCSVPLYTICNYATQKDLYNDVDCGENPFKIIRSILTNSGLSMYPDASKDDGGTLVRNRYSPPSCNSKVHFITNQNMYSLDAVQYLLSVAPGVLDPTPPAYLIYNLKDKKAFVTTRENLFKPKNIDAQPKSTQAIYSITDTTIGKQYQMRDIKTDSANEELGGIENAKLFYNHNFYGYSHKDRAWENNKVNKFTLNELLTKGAAGAESSLYLKNANEDMELAKYYQYAPINFDKIYHVMKSLELFSSNLQFSVDGNLDLDVGHVINITQNDDKHKQEMFHGKWMIVKIRHSFRNKEYKSNIICSRTYYSKVL